MREHSDVEVQPKRGRTLAADNSKEAGVADIAILTPNRPPSLGASELRPEEPPSIRTIVQPTPTWSERAASALQPWLAWIVAGWCFGIVVFSLRPLLGWHMLRRLRRIGVSPVPDEVLAALERMSGRLGVRRAVRVVRSTLTQVPVVVIDEKRRWGGIAKLSGKDAAKPASVQLERCGSAKVRFIDEKGNPIPKIDVWTNFVITPGANIFRFNVDGIDSPTAKSALTAETACAPYSTCRKDTDSEGRIMFTCLIPGATYQLCGQSAITGGAMPFGSDFRVAPGQVLDLGDIQVKARKR